MALAATVRNRLDFGPQERTQSVQEINAMTLMRRREFLRDSAIVTLAVSALGPISARSLDFPAVVSPDWLSQNVGSPGLAVLDIRSAEQYKKGHIPGAVHAPVSSWAVSRDGLSVELPTESALRELLGRLGLKPEARIVVVNRNETDFNRADAMRVAWTCMTAGIENTAVLDGGHNRWVKEIKSVSTLDTSVQPGVYEGKMNGSLAVPKSYVLNRIGKSLIVDTRLPEDYFGIASKPGHIKGAVNLPAPWIFAGDGTIRKEEDLRAMAVGVLGSNSSKEVILYCGVGGFAAAWWFVLTRVLGYRNAKVYDGSIEEWVKDPTSPVSRYTWN